MHREYDASLVDVLQNETYQIEEDGLVIEVKPVPDDDRRHVLDPRVLEAAKRKMSNAGVQPKWTSLLGVRHRPDKVSYPLASTDVAMDETLVDAGDRFIDLFSWDPVGRETPSAALIYLHGGGFTAGDVTLFRNQLAFIAEQSGAMVFFPEYRLAPETPFPGAIDDCEACVRYVLEHADELGIDPARVVIAGDSAGGSLSNACIQRLPAGTFAAAVELYPGADFGEEDPDWSYDLYPAIPEHEVYARARVDRLRDGVDATGMLYVHDGTPMTHPLISACSLSAEELAAFPPVLVMTAEYDYIRPQGEKLARLLQEAGVDARAVRYAGCDHGFFDWPGIRPQTEDACLMIADVLKGTA